MARGIEAFFYYPTVGSGMWDAVTGRFCTPTAGTATVSATAEGPAFKFTDTRAVLTARNPLAVDTRGITIICRYRMKALPAAVATVFSYNSWTGSEYNRGVFVGATSTQAHAVGLYTSNGSEFGTGGLGTGELNKFHTVAIQHDPTTNVTYFSWIDGVAQGSRSDVTGSSAVTGGATRLNIARDPTGYDNAPDGEILWAVAFNRYLTNAEHAWWHRNAFETLEGRHLARYSISSGGVATLSIVGAQTLTAVTQAATVTELAALAGGQTLSAVTQAATATALAALAGAQTLTAVTQAATVATAPASIVGAQTLDVAVQAATATALAALAGGQTLSAVTQAATATALDAIDGSQTLASVVQLAAIAGVITREVAGAQTLDAVSQAATATELAAAVAAQTLDVATQAGTLSAPGAIVGGQTLTVVTQAATSVAIAALLGGQTLDSVSQAATADSVIAINGAQTLVVISQSAAVDTGAPAANDSDFIVRVRRRRS